jgi:hypothetical protein
MKAFLFIVCLAAMGSQTVAAGAVSWFPWFHTRPKPVLLEDQVSPSPVASQNRVVYRGSGSTRPFTEDGSKRRAIQEQQSRPRLSDLLTRGWRSGETSRNKDK